MAMSMLIVIGAIIGVVISALSHPLIYKGVFGGHRTSDDHRPDVF